MVNRRSRRGRRQGRRRNPRSRRNFSNLSRPLVNVRPRAFRHTREGHGNVALNLRRKLTAYTINPDKSSSWLMDGLKWAGRLVMSLLGVNKTVTMNDLLDILPHDEIERLFPSYSLDDAKIVFNPMGSFVSWKIGPEDLVAEHDGLSRFHENDTTGDKSVGNYINFESGLIEWISISVHPGVTVAQREGQIAMAFQPCGLGFDLVDDAHPHGFHQIMSLPNSVCGEASRPLTITWSPSARDAASMWRGIGNSTHLPNTTNDPLLPGFTEATGGDPACIWYFAYSAHGDGEIGSSHYSPSSATFAVYVDGRVRLRSPTADPAPCRVTPWGIFKKGLYQCGPRGEPLAVNTKEVRVLDPHGRRVITLEENQDIDFECV